MVEKDLRIDDGNNIDSIVIDAIWSVMYILVALTSERYFDFSVINITSIEDYYRK